MVQDIDPKQIKFWTNFPVITINDMVNAQYNLLDFFKIDKLLLLLVVQWVECKFLQFVSNFPDKAKLQFLLLALLVIQHKILLSMNLVDKQLWLILIGNGNILKINQIKVWQLQEWLLILLILSKKGFKKNLEENYKKEMI